MDISRLDLGAMLYAIGRPLFYWIVVVIGTTLFGYPGVVCVTPMAWLLALLVGRDCVLRSKSILDSQVLLEASLAGGFFGLACGLLAILVAGVAMPIQADEMRGALIISIIMLLAGMIISALLAFGFGLVCQRRFKGEK